MTPLHLGMINAEHRETVERHILDELAVGFLDLVEPAVMFEVLGSMLVTTAIVPSSRRKLPSLSSARRPSSRSSRGRHLSHSD
jgi:hypothetical protein